MTLVLSTPRPSSSYKRDMRLKDRCLPIQPRHCSAQNHSLLMIDHQYLQMLTIRSHDASELINHAWR